MAPIAPSAAAQPITYFPTRSVRPKSAIHADGPKKLRRDEGVEGFRRNCKFSFPSPLKDEAKARSNSMLRTVKDGVKPTGLSQSMVLNREVLNTLARYRGS